jgi:HK97 gp10 family phage protein
VLFEGSKVNISVNVRTNIKSKEVLDKTEKAAEKALKNVIVDIAADAVKGSPVDTGHNRRSIDYEAKGLSGSVFSTSGYGGYLEVGTRKMIARPYFKPALDKNIDKLPKEIEANLK